MPCLGTQRCIAVPCWLGGRSWETSAILLFDGVLEHLSFGNRQLLLVLNQYEQCQVGHLHVDRVMNFLPSITNFSHQGAWLFCGALKKLSLGNSVGDTEGIRRGTENPLGTVRDLLQDAPRSGSSSERNTQGHGGDVLEVKKDIQGVKTLLPALKATLTHSKGGQEGGDRTVLRQTGRQVLWLALHPCMTTCLLYWDSV